MANVMRDGIGAPALGASVGLREPGGHARPALATRCWSRRQSQAKTWNAQAVPGFILALLGALTSFVPIVNVAGDFLAFLGLIVAVIALIKARSRGADTGLSMAAIILAVAAFVISAVINVAVVVALDSTATNLGVGQDVTSYHSH
jgi:ABC-type transport system involved in cytochrome c biogenesis permease subunit